MSGKPADKADAPRLPEGVTVRKRKVADYQRDSENLNAGTPRGRKMIAQSYGDVGPARSWVASADDVLIAGNHSQGGALDAGVEDVVEIEVPDGVQVVVKRADVRAGDSTAKKIAAYDNRSRDVDSSWNADQLAADRTLLEAADIFRPDEIDALIADQTAVDVVAQALAAFDDEMGEDEPARGLTNERNQVVKLALYLPDVATVERAIKAAAADLGTTNRAEAVAHIFEHYLESAER